MALAALEAVGGPALAQRHAKAAKAEVAQSCERIFAGDFIGEVEVKQAALAWVPEAMRFGPATDTPVDAEDLAPDSPGDGEALDEAVVVDSGVETATGPVEEAA